MISKSNVKSVSCDDVRVFHYLFQNNVSKTLLDFFCDSRNNQGLGKCHQPRPSARLITLTSLAALIIPDVTKNSFKNCLLLK